MRLSEAVEIAFEPRYEEEPPTIEEAFDDLRVEQERHLTDLLSTF